MAIVDVVQIADTHCHLYFDVFDTDREQVIERARQKGIYRLLIPGLDIETSKLAFGLAHTYNEVFAAVGIHPNEAVNWTTASENELKKLAVDEKVVAIGEIGLDYYRNRSSVDLQKSIFKCQLDLAAEMDLPVIIHNRDSSDDIYHILNDWHSMLVKSGLKLANRPGVLHAFSGDRIFAESVLSLNFKLGVAGPVTFQKKSEDLQSLVSELDLEHLLVETDSPFLSPHPFRGKRNEPANVRIVAEKISMLKGDPLERVAKITTAAANKLFRWSDSH